MAIDKVDDDTSQKRPQASSIVQENLQYRPGTCSLCGKIWKACYCQSVGSYPDLLLWGSLCNMFYGVMAGLVNMVAALAFCGHIYGYC